MELLQHRLGARIRALRTERGYTQESFADACGLHRNYMGAIERGEQNVTIKTLRILARRLGVTISSLFDGLESEN